MAAELFYEIQQNLIALNYGSNRVETVLAGYPLGLLSGL